MQEQKQREYIAELKVWEMQFQAKHQEWLVALTYQSQNGDEYSQLSPWLHRQECLLQGPALPGS